MASSLLMSLNIYELFCTCAGCTDMVRSMSGAVPTYISHRGIILSSVKFISVSVPLAISL